MPYKVKESPSHAIIHAEDPVSAFQIHSCHPVTGDWFVVTQHHDSRDGDRWFIERVVLWALGKSDNSVDRVQAITASGLPHEDEDADTYLVDGRDASPFGKTWNEVYASMRPSRQMVRELPSTLTVADDSE